MELRLVAIETDGIPPSRDAPKLPVAVESAAIEPTAEPVDRYLADATREHQGGYVDQPLWVRAASLAEGDEAAALAAYLRARATALRLADRRERGSASAERRRSAASADAEEGDTAAPVDADGGEAPPTRAPGTVAWRRWWPAFAALAVVGVAAAYLGLARTDPGEVPPAAPVAAPSGNGAGSPSGAAGGPAVPSPAAAAAAAAELRAEREAKVQQLMAAGNWNVLVLHAAEWSRKDPANANAWKHLSVGYANLRQVDDAFGAAEKAAQLAPTDREVWKNLGRVSIAADRPDLALHAFEQAVALDEQDAASLVQVGRLNAQLGRLPEAKAAFDRALTVQPADGDAQCGQMHVAQKQGRGKDADAIARELKRLGKECSEPEAMRAPPAAAASATLSKAVPGRSR